MGGDVEAKVSLVGAGNGATTSNAVTVKVTKDDKKVDEVKDPRDLTTAERMLLMEQALETSDQDNERFLQKFRERLDRVNLKFPTIEVRFEDLNIEAKVYVGTRALPTLLNFTRNAFSYILTSLHLLPDSRRKFPILNNVSGVLKPGRMTLLLGPPGAGKSTLLKALAGKLDDDLKFSGSVAYNGHSFDEFVSVRTASYVSQNDVHLGEMTVRETLDFSARVQGPGYRARLADELQKREKEMGINPDVTMDAVIKALAVEGNPTNITTDYMLKVLGLDVCAEIFVGNDMVRGVSGGQKKRVTSGEMLVGPKQALFMDEISTGLDSSTTYLITKCLRNIVHYQDATVLIALLQPAPETYDLFDDILLLAEGHIIYHGPREDIMTFFNSIGFQCPPRKGVADFLQEVTSLKDQEQYWAKKDAPYSFVSVQAFADAFANTKLGTSISHELSTPFPKENSPEGALEKEKYALPTKEMLTAVFVRDALLMSRNGFLYIAQIIQMFIVALVTITVFFRTTLDRTIEDGNFYLGAIFFGLIMMLFNGFAEMSLLITRLPVFYKQRDAFLYPAWSWSIPMWLLSIPFSFISSFVWTCVTYYVIGFAPQPGRFFASMLLMFLVHQLSIGLFRLLGALGRSEVVANTFGAFALIILFLLGGFILAKRDIHPYWIWGFWISPLAYAENALAANEFLAPRWQKMPATGQLTIGKVVLSSRSLFHHQYWVWIGVACLAGYCFLFNFLTMLALHFLTPLGKPQPLVSEELIEEKHAARTGESISRQGSRAGSRRSRRGAGSALERFKISSASTIGGVTKVVTNTSKAVATGALGAVNATANVISDVVHTAGEVVNAAAHLGHAHVTDEGAALEAGEGSRRGMVLPFVPLSLSFHNVNYYVDMPAEMKAEGATEDRLQLLKNVSGAFRPKVLTALVGVSGAGKTTLMDVLAGRKTGGYIEGDVRVSGFPKVQQTFARIAGYCEQNDIHSPQVTVHESLRYSAWLRLPAKEVDEDVREEFVEEVMELVELDSMRDALVGLPGVNGLSTEQRKRLTIAVELVANPSIIFMDEPTSGLDARAAAIVMRTVRNTVDTGRTVVCTIHQPSIDIFEAFDELLLMKRGGQVIYMGPLGTNSQILVDYFQAIEGVPPIRDGYNPATWMLEISSPASAENLGYDFAELFAQSEQFRKNEEMIKRLSVPPEGHEDLKFETQYATDYKTQLYACLWKRNQMYWRAPDYNVVRYFFCTMMGLLVGGVFFDLGQRRGKQQDVLNIMGALYTASLFMGWNNASSVQPIIAVERTVFYRERAAGYYGAIPYAIAQGLIEIPYIVVQTFIYSLVTYSLIHFQWTWAKFWWYTLYMFLTLLYFTCYGMMAISITPNPQLAMVVSAFFFSLWNLFSGFLISRPKIPVWWRWYYWIDPVAWTLYGLITSQLGDVQTTIKLPDDRVITVKDWLSEYFGYDHDWLGFVVLALLSFVVMFFTVFAYALKTLNFQKR